jgi:hypothetical protein
MALGDQASAQAAFTAAAALAPAAAEPLVGLAMTEGMSGTAGLETADAQLRTIEARFPTNQVVAFNLGWLAVYRKDVATVREAWARTIALGVKTPLGAAAYVLLNEVNKKTTK